MITLQPKELKKEAALRLATTHGNHSKVAFVYSAVALGAGFLTLLVHFITGMMIDNTGGLGDLGTRAILESIDMIFSLAVNVLLPLWTFGMIRTALAMCRQKRTEPRDLLRGFSRWGLYLRLCIFEGLIYFILMYASLQAITMLISFTPLADGIVEAFTPYLEDPELLDAAMADPATMMGLLKAMMPVLILWAAGLPVLLVPVSYALRLAVYRIGDEDRPGAFRAIRQSRKMMKGHKMQLFKLDLSFWWYYLIQILLALLLEVPVFLAGTVIPLSIEVLTLIAGAVQALGCLLLYQKHLLKVQTTYALFYDTLYEQHSAPPIHQVSWQ